MSKSKPKKTHSGFSLPEIAMVLLVIGLLLAGIASASRLVNYTLLNTAREVTENTAINYMRRDVVIWLDSTSKESFSDSETNNDSSISVWSETKSGTATLANAAQSTVSKQPIYVASAINGLPALRFDGLDDLMSITANYTTSSFPPFCNSFSVFLLAQAMENITVATESASGTAGQTSQRYALFPPSGDVVYSGSPAPTSSAGISFGLNGVSFYENANSYTPPIMSSPAGYSPPVAILMEYNNKTPKLYVNGRLVRSGLTSSKGCVFPPFHIGGGPSPWTTYGNFSGYIGEIIMIDRALTAEERVDIFTYLKKKWKLNSN